MLFFSTSSILRSNRTTHARNNQKQRLRSRERDPSLTENSRAKCWRTRGVFILFFLEFLSHFVDLRWGGGYFLFFFLKKKTRE